MAVILDPGRLTRKVTIQRQVAATHLGAQRLPAWETVATVWAEILPMSGREGWQAKQVNAELTHRVRIRYRTDVTAGCQIILGGRTLRIDGPPRDLDEAHVALEFDCVEVK